MPPAIAAASAAIALFAGIFAAVHGVHHSASNSAASKGKPEVLGQVFARTPSTTTSTTTAVPQAPPTSKAPTPTTVTTAAPKPAAPAVAKPAAARTPARTTQQVNGECGTGGAGATLQSKITPRQHSANTDYETDIAVFVKNNVNKPIQIDALAIRLVWNDGTPPQDYTFAQAVGAVLQPNQLVEYTVAIRSNTPPSTVELTNFAFHTAGQPQCTGKPA
jgi:hypothetical protein